ncbi:MAG: hypothetical protein ACHRXM_37255 [Isosphaerales bacterium]
MTMHARIRDLLAFHSSRALRKESSRRRLVLERLEHRAPQGPSWGRSA